MMVGILKPDSGTVTINGDGDPTSSAVRTKIGNAPQAIALYNRLTAWENLAFFGRIYGLFGKRLHDCVIHALEFVGLTERGKDIVGTFSGGMQRRLNLAAAMVHDPSIYLLDEPTVGVDPQSRNMIFDSIEKLKRDGRTILYTTHYMEGGIGQEYGRRQRHPAQYSGPDQRIFAVRQFRNRGILDCGKSRTNTRSLSCQSDICSD
jgi:ABC-2 type transport system ATP-binding protein